MYRTSLRYCFFIACLFSAFATKAQIGLSDSSSSSGLGLGSRKTQSASSFSQLPEKPVDYIIGGITVSGPKYLDEDLLLAVTGLNVGEKITLPGDAQIAKAIRNLWRQELFSDVRIDITNIVGDKIFLNIAVEERPRLSRYNFKGIKKGEANELKDKVNLVKSRVVTEATKKEGVVRIQKYYADKGYNHAKVHVRERADTLGVNTIILTFDIDKGVKGRINQINISGNDHASTSKVKRNFKSTKEMPRLTLHPADELNMYEHSERTFGKYMSNYGFLSLSKTLEALDPYFRFNIFTSSKFNEQKYEEDKESVVTFYNSLGYRDAVIEKDTVYALPNGNLNVDVKVSEGRRYYFGDIEWKGNTKYTNENLTRVLGIKRGDVYNQQLLDTRMGKMLNPEGGEDVSSMYMDDGYLFFNIDAVETSIIGDTINYEMRITEGPQATIRNITIAGNDRTNEHVIRRE